MELKRQIAWAQTLRPAKEQPLLKPNGEPVWHGFTGNRFAFPLPPESHGPIRARDVKRKKGIPGY
jgi:hypothetical protein